MPVLGSHSSFPGEYTGLQKLCSEAETKVRAAEKCLCNQLGNVPVLRGKANFTAQVFRELRDFVAI